MKTDNNPIKITHVVAKDRQNCIGQDNALAWHLPEDLQHFKRLTTGGIILMGRKTFESLARPLPNRTNIVITNNTSYLVPDGVLLFHDLTQAIAHAKMLASAANQERIFIIGGGEVYRQSLAMADILEITEVDLEVQGDAFYPNIGDEFSEVWRSDKQVDEKSGVAFSFVRYEKSA